MRITGLKNITIPGINIIQIFTYGTFTQIWRLAFGLWSIPLCDSKTVTVKTLISIARIKLVFSTSIVCRSVSLALVTKVSFLIAKIQICVFSVSRLDDKFFISAANKVYLIYLPYSDIDELRGQNIGHSFLLGNCREPLSKK